MESFPKYEYFQHKKRGIYQLLDAAAAAFIDCEDYQNWIVGADPNQI